MSEPDPPAAPPARPASAGAVSTWWSIAEITGRIARGDVRVVDVVGAVLDRIDALDPALCAYASVWSERALARAAALDATAIARRGPLHGVPIAVKDLCDVRGEPTRAGTTALGDEPADADATVVKQLESAGAVILGKLKMTEGAYTTHHPSVVPPRNPWNASRWTGISSSGSGVAVAAGLCTAALGTDTGGSIRFPSAACGVVGLKPSHGRVSLAGVFPLAPSLDHIGPMARSVDDAARIFSVIAGPDERDPTSLRATTAIRSAPHAVAGLRLGFDPVYCVEGVDAEVSDAVARALDALQAAGAEQQPVEMPPIGDVLAAWMPICATEVANAHADTFPARREQYGPGLAALIDAGRAVTGRALAAACAHRLAYTRKLAAVFDVCDVIVCPALAARWPAGVDLGGADPPQGAFTAMRFTLPFNLSGHPSLTLPVCLDGDGAPIGVQLVGRIGEEATLLALGAALEQRGVGRIGHPC